MSNTPNKPPTKPEDKDEFDSLDTGGHRRVEERHAEMVDVHKKMIDVQVKIVQATKSISRATWLYGIMAGLTLFWLVVMFSLDKIYF